MWCIIITDCNTDPKPNPNPNPDPIPNPNPNPNPNLNHDPNPNRVFLTGRGGIVLSAMSSTLILSSTTALPV